MDPRAKKICKIFALVIALVLAGGVLMFANALVGNPISKAIVKHRAETFLEERFSDTDYAISKIDYNFKDGDYYVRITSPTSEDSAFSISYTMSGKYKYDTYDQNVVGRENTFRRLDEEYRKRCEELLQSRDFPYRDALGWGFGNFFDSAYPPEDPSAERMPGVTPEPFPISSLELDAAYPIGELGAKYGLVVLDIEIDERTPEKAAEILLATKQLMTSGETPFFSIDLTLSPIRDEYDNYAEGTRIYIENFSWDDIYEDGLLERVQTAIEETNAYYDWLNSQGK